MAGLRLGTCVVAVALVAALPACVVQTNEPPARSVVVAGPPPPPVPETQPPPPQPAALWVPGYWHWTGMQYAWIPGRWESPPPGTHWYGPQYGIRSGTYFYEPGGWGPPK
jgi:hypothetical protein